MGVIIIYFGVHCYIKEQASLESGTDGDTVVSIINDVSVRQYHVTGGQELINTAHCHLVHERKRFIYCAHLKI